MFNEKKVKDLILASLVTDAYCLGTHWVYDENQLRSAPVDFNSLNAPMAMWHKGKTAGDFTHYGDQTYWLYEFIEENKETIEDGVETYKSFDANEFLKFWENKMSSYDGYVDGACRNTLENIKNGVTPSGSASSDLSIVGRVAPLLLASSSESEFLKNVEDFTALTHNSQLAKNASRFFAKVIIDRFKGLSTIEAIEKNKESFDTQIQGYVNQGLASKNKVSFDAIREFGPACGVDGGFAGVIHLLCKYDNLKDMLIANAKAGGDSSARAMIASIIFMVDKPISQIPASWLNIKVKL
jgi:ADP-ribosylglycohydrolase